MLLHLQVNLYLRKHSHFFCLAGKEESFFRIICLGEFIAAVDRVSEKGIIFYIMHLKCVDECAIISSV